MTAGYPRVLVVSSDDFAASSGTGITLRNLFESWPIDCLAQVHLSPPSGSHEIARVRYPLSAVPVDALARRLTRGRSVAVASGAPRIAAVPLPPDASAAARRHAAARAALDLSPVLPARSVRRFIDEFSPDVIYSLMGSVRVMRLCTRVSRRWQTPLVPHFMDDWPSTLYSSGELAGFARTRAISRLEDALSLAPLAMCISEQMCVEYENRYGLTCHAFVNPVRVPAMAAPPNASPLRLIYAGGLHLGRWESLVRLAESLGRLEPAARLTVFAPDCAAVSVPPHLSGVLHLGGTLEPEEIPARLQDADVLVHVESFDESTTRYARLSLSTKIPQYLASGRPVIAFGPSDMASQRVVEKSGGGVVIGAQEADAILGRLKTLVASSEARLKMGAAGREYAVAAFSQEQVRERLRDVLTAAAGAS